MTVTHGSIKRAAGDQITNNKMIATILIIAGLVMMTIAAVHAFITNENQ